MKNEIFYVRTAIMSCSPLYEETRNLEVTVTVTVEVLTKSQILQSLCYSSHKILTKSHSDVIILTKSQLRNALPRLKVKMWFF